MSRNVSAHYTPRDHQTITFGRKIKSSGWGLERHSTTNNWRANIYLSVVRPRHTFGENPPYRRNLKLVLQRIKRDSFKQLCAQANIDPRGSTYSYTISYTPKTEVMSPQKEPQTGWLLERRTRSRDGAHIRRHVIARNGCRKNLVSTESGP